MKTGGGDPLADLPLESEKLRNILVPDIQDTGNPYDNDSMSSMGKLSL